MIGVLKKIFSSKIFRITTAAILMYLAFRKVNIVDVFFDLLKAPWWFVLIMIIYGFFSTVLSAYRWSIVLLGKSSFKDIILFTKAIYIGGFYGMFLPTSLGADIVKWYPIHKAHKNISKAEILGSILVDRIIGFSAFILVAFIAAVLAKIIHFDFPDYLFYLFAGLGFGVIVFFVLLFLLDLNKIVQKLPFSEFFKNIIKSLESENMSVIIRAFLISFVAEMVWFLPVWLVSNVFGAGMSLLSVYILIPVISLLMTLPISVMGGFGGREYLFLYFFGKMGIAKEGILTVSTFMGLLGIVGSLLGGIWIIFDQKND